MNDPPSDDRSPMAVAYAWAWRVTTISMEMVIPGLVGLAVDRWLGSVVAFTILGFAAGMTLGIWHLVKLGSPGSTKRPNPREDDPS